MRKSRKDKTPRRRKSVGSGGTASAAPAAGLTGDEARLWSHITRSASKLSVKAANRVSQVANDANFDRALFEEMMAVPARQLGSDATARARAAVGVGVGYGATPGNPVRHQPVEVAFDKRRARKVAKGRIEIEARIDLHGMRQREAHSALRSFLLDCHARGHRLVLVITGKGMGWARDDAQYDNQDRHWGDSFEQPGILKRNVPGWMAEADLAAIVASYSGAHRTHGGDGALYVQLKKRMPHKPRL